jgi:ADP-ribose pyrophosphatase YjhB (NUDIX family)
MFFNFHEILMKTYFVKTNYNSKYLWFRIVFFQFIYLIFWLNNPYLLVLFILIIILASYFFNSGTNNNWFIYKSIYWEKILFEKYKFNIAYVINFFSLYFMILWLFFSFANYLLPTLLFVITSIILKISYLEHTYKIFQQYNETYWIVCVWMFIENNWKILILKRSESSKKFAWAWEIPWWKVEHNESLETALAREAKEELWNEIIIWNQYSTYEYFDENIWICMILYFVKLENYKNIQLNSEEHSEFKRIWKNEVEKYLSEKNINQYLYVKKWFDILNVG